MLFRTAWLKQVAEDIFKDNEFLQFALNWDEYVQDGVKTVTIPQSGTGSTVVRNRSSFPATVSERSDSDITYDMNDYTTDPRRVRSLLQKQYSYDYRASVIRQDTAKAKEMIAEDILYAWRAEVTKRILKTTGSAVAASVNSTATGNRKSFTFADLMRVDKAMNDDNIPKSGRIAVISSQAKLDLLNDPAVKGTQIFQQLADYKEGTISRVMTFDLMVRSTALTYNATGTAAKLSDAAQATTDCDAALFWHPNFVGRSMGNNQVFFNAGQATHYGDILSMELQAGGSKYYSDGRGVIALVQDQAA